MRDGTASPGDPPRELGSRGAGPVPECGSGVPPSPSLGFVLGTLDGILLLAGWAPEDLLGEDERVEIVYADLEVDVRLEGKRG